MMAARRITAPLTEIGRQRYDQARARIDEIRGEVAADLPELLGAARRAKALHDAAQSPTREIVALLKAEREAQGIDLSELALRMRVPVGDLMKLERGEAMAGNLGTLNLYAVVLGKRLSVTLSASA